MQFNKVIDAAGKLFSPKEGSLRVRYSKGENGPKNTLLTYGGTDGLIYFGIARCNPEDRFSRKVGKAKATSRMLVAMKPSIIPDMGFSYSLNSLYGRCTIDRVKDLLTHFQEIDQRINEERKSTYRSRELLAIAK